MFPKQGQNSISKFILGAFQPIFALAPEDVKSLGESTLIPIFPKDCILALISETIDTLSAKGVAPRINNKVTIVGDLHGNFHDLVRILLVNGLPPRTNYVFLGDYVDRGEFSLEVMIVLFTLLNVYPSQITLLRGNHEHIDTNREYGFRENIVSLYQDDEVWVQFNKAFDYLSIACVLFDKILCVHGGITPKLKSMDDIDKLTLPIETLPPLVDDLLWSDPVDDDIEYIPSTRGVGLAFGPKATEQFLETLHFNLIIRAHQPAMAGVEYKHHSKVITVFSSSNYNDFGNVCGYLTVSPGLDAKVLDPIHPLKRIECLTKRIKPPTIFGASQRKLTQAAKPNLHARRSSFKNRIPNDSNSNTRKSAAIFTFN